MKKFFILAITAILLASCDTFSQASNPLAGTTWDGIQNPKSIEVLPCRLEFRNSKNVVLSFIPEVFQSTQTATGKYTVVGNTVTFKQPLVLAVVVDSEYAILTVNGAHLAGEELVVHYELELDGIYEGARKAIFIRIK